MMINFAGKWEEIEQSSRASTSIRVAAEHKLNLYIAYSDDSKRQLKLRSHSPVFESGDLPEFENIYIEVGEFGRESELCITLIDNSLRDLFTAITSDLVNASAIAETEEGAARIFANRLVRWAELLEAKKRHGLSIAQQLGLLGELRLIEWILSTKLATSATTIYGWRGPNGDARDINLGGISIEVKASLGSSRNVLNISSLDQLDTEERRLVVSYCRFSQSDIGISLCSLVQSIESLLVAYSSEWVDLWRKLHLIGYDSDADYVNLTYQIQKHTFYEIRDNFPRLVPGNVVSDIRSANYQIDCTNLTVFEISDLDLEGIINGGC